MQDDLFGDARIEASIPGLVYQREFLTADDERGLLDIIAALPLQAAQYKQYVARRRVMSFGGSYDFDANRLLPATPLDERLLPLRDRAAAWLGVDPAALVQALVAEYAPGTPLGWHRDVPDFERIVGVSLGGGATLRFRPYPYTPALQRQGVRLQVAPRSIYRLEREARWAWQHSVDPTEAWRWSITFRTARHAGA